MTKRDAWREERVAAEYEARGIRRVLDLPTGTGRLLPALRAAELAAVGADVALEMMRAGRRLRPSLRSSGSEPALLVQADAARLPFRSAAFDAVVSLRFLFHLEPLERRAALAEMRRVTRDGVVVGEVRYRWTLKHLGRWLRSRVGLARRYKPSEGRAELARELSAAGLELVELRPVSRLFSDKALFLARPPHAARGALPAEVGFT